MPPNRGYEKASQAVKSASHKRSSSQPSSAPRPIALDTTSPALHSLHLLTLSDALQDILQNGTSRKPTSSATPIAPVVPASSWIADLTETNEPSLTPIQSWWKASFPKFDDRLHRKWSGSWEPLPLSQTADPAAGILKNPIFPPGIPSLGGRTSLGVDGFSVITKVNTETNQGDGPMALLVRKNDNVGWDAATEVDSENDSVAGDDDAPEIIDPEEVSVESVLGIKRSSREWEADDPRLPSAKRPRIDAFPSLRPAFVSAAPSYTQREEASQGPHPASQASDLETQSSTQVELMRPRKVMFGPDPDGHPHRTKAKSMSTQHRKKQAEKRRKAAKATASSKMNEPPSPGCKVHDTQATKEELKAKEERHFAIRDRVYEGVGALLEMYEHRVLLNYGLDLREIRRCYTLQPWNPNAKKRSVQRADSVWKTLDGPEQWKLCTPAIGEYVRIAYPPEDHPAWSIVDGGAVLRWKQSEEYVFRRTGECEVGVDESEVPAVKGEQSRTTEPLVEGSGAVPEEFGRQSDLSEEARSRDQPDNPPGPEPSTSANRRRRSSRTTTTAALASSRKSTRLTRSSSVGVLPPLLRRHSSETLSSRPARNTRSRARARSTVTPLPQTHSRRLRSMAPSS